VASQVMIRAAERCVENGGSLGDALDEATRVAMDMAVASTGPLPSAYVPVGLTEVLRIDLERLLGMTAR
jgi:hypothetical protein